MLNTIIIIGRLGRDPEMTYSKDGKEITKFSVATDDGWGENKQTTWHNVVCFGKTAEASATYLHKGSLVAAQGRQQHRQYDDKDGNKRYFSEIVADRVQFLDPKGGFSDDPDGVPERNLGEGHIDPDSLPF